MKVNLVGAFIRNFPYGSEIAYAKGFKEIGCQVNTVDPSYQDQKLIKDADITILFNDIQGYVRELVEETSGVKIAYQSDDSQFAHVKESMIRMLKYCDHALTFDVEGANIAKELGYKKSRQILLSADNELYTPDDSITKSIDFCFIGNFSNVVVHKSRRHMIEVLSKKYKVGYAESVYDPRQISRTYNASKVVLNHATDLGQPFGSGYGYQCRHFEVGFSKTCLLSNKVLGENKLFNFFTFGSEKELLDQADFLMSNDTNRRNCAEQFYDELYKNHLPKHRAQEILEFATGVK